MRRGLRKQPPGTSDLFARPDEEAHLTVSQLTRRIKSCLEDGIGRVMVEGEISRITRPASGHVYLTIKDSGAVLDVVMWRSSAARLRFSPAEGEQVIVRGEITVYEKRGNYQMVASSIQPVGKGNLQQQFEELVARLREEGLFDPAHKKPLPPIPSTVGVVTSRTGAAVRDMIKVLRRRMPGVRIVLSPCLVQGETAAADIVRALSALERWGQCDVIIVGRGGGSLEDLWAFNEEPVARAIYAASTPIVSAVGHEVDMSVSDLVADLRAATPSEAAEAVVPDMNEYVKMIAGYRRALAQALLSRIRDARTRLNALARSSILRRPMDMIRQRQQQLDESFSDLTNTMKSVVEHNHNQLSLASARLEGLSPLSVLSRGYSVTTLKDGTVLRHTDDITPDTEIHTRLSRGELISVVRGIMNTADSEKAET